MLGIGKCRVCGCTDNNACITEEGPCWWINDLFKDLCSSCAINEFLDVGDVNI